MACKGSATTHNSRHNGHGPRVSRPRYAIATTGLVRGAPLKSKRVAPWYLKAWASRAEKLLPAALAA